MKKLSIFIAFVIVCSIKIVNAQPYIISTVAGNGDGHSGWGGYSQDGIPATAAEINLPSTVAVDDTGNVYICDAENSRIRKVNKSGIISTFAGRGDSGWVLNDGHLATNASLSEPWGVAWGKRGVYIADWNNRRIRWVNNKGIISTIAGTGAYGYSGDGGMGDTATMSDPYGICVDKFGNVYFCDAFNNVIRKIDTFGIITTFAGTSVKADYGDGGKATAAGINEPLGVHCDTFGNIYICTFVYIRKVDLNGIITTVCGNGSYAHSGDGGLATQASMAGPFDACVDDSGNLFFGEYAYYTGNYVRRVNASDGIIKSIAGNGTRGYNNYEGNPDTAKFWFLLGSIADHFGNIFLCDQTNNLVRELSPCTAPVVTSPLNAHICPGVSIALTAQGHNTYSWSPGNSLRDSVGYTVIASPSVTTTYTITGTTCTANATIVVTVNNQNAPKLSLSPARDTLCLGQNVTLSVSGSSGYTWSPSWELSSSTGVSVLATPTANTTYIVTEPTCSATDTSFIIVNPVPGVGIYPATTTEFCAGQTVTLYEYGANQYLWTPMSGIDTTSYDSANANPTITTTYTIIGKSLNCYSQPTTIVLTVHPIPVVTINPPNPGYCTGSGDSVTIIAGGAATYQWSPFVNISDTIGDTIVANPLITTTYAVVGTAFGCVSPPDTFTVSVDTLPIIIISPPSATVCQGSGTQLIANGAANYSWTPSNGLNETTGSSVTADPTINTTYTITGTTGGCSAITTEEVGVVPAPNKPAITVSVTGDSLISTATQGNQWYLNDTLIAGATNQVLVINGNKGSYTVQVINPANGCDAISDPLVITGIYQLSAKNNQLSIYPNPGTGELHIEAGAEMDEIKVTNVLGQLIYEARPKQAQFTFELKDEGMYFVTVTSGSKTTTYKVVVNK